MTMRIDISNEAYGLAAIVEDHILRIGGEVSLEYVVEAAVGFLVAELGVDEAASRVKREAGQ